MNLKLDLLEAWRQTFYDDVGGNVTPPFWNCFPGIPKRLRGNKNPSKICFFLEVLGYALGGFLFIPFRNLLKGLLEFPLCFLSLVLESAAETVPILGHALYGIVLLPFALVRCLLSPIKSARRGWFYGQILAGRMKLDEQGQYTYEEGSSPSRGRIVGGALAITSLGISLAAYVAAVFFTIGVVGTAVAPVLSKSSIPVLVKIGNGLSAAAHWCSTIFWEPWMNWTLGQWLAGLTTHGATIGTAAVGALGETAAAAAVGIPTVVCAGSIPGAVIDSPRTLIGGFASFVKGNDRLIVPYPRHDYSKIMETRQKSQQTPAEKPTQSQSGSKSRSIPWYIPWCSCREEQKTPEDPEVTDLLKEAPK